MTRSHTDRLEDELSLYKMAGSAVAQSKAKAPERQFTGAVYIALLNKSAEGDNGLTVDELVEQLGKTYPGLARPAYEQVIAKMLGDSTGEVQPAAIQDGQGRITLTEKGKSNAVFHAQYPENYHPINNPGYFLERNEQGLLGIHERELMEQTGHTDLVLLQAAASGIDPRLMTPELARPVAQIHAALESFRNPGQDKALWAARVADGNDQAPQQRT